MSVGCPNEKKKKKTEFNISRAKFFNFMILMVSFWYVYFTAISSITFFYRNFFHFTNHNSPRKKETRCLRRLIRASIDVRWEDLSELKYLRF